MSINLDKGSKIDLRKSITLNETKENDLSKITIGLGWDVRKKTGWFSSSDSDYDLDACALLLENDKLRSNSDIIYYNNKKHNSGKIWSKGDNLTGQGEGDDEQIVAKLDELDSKYNKVVFYATIYQGKSRNQNFSMLENTYIRALNNNDNEITKFAISGNSELKGKCSFIFAEAIRENGTWMFKAIGEGLDTDRVDEVADKYK